MRGKAGVGAAADKALGSMYSTSFASILSRLTPSDKIMGVVLTMSDVSATRSGEGLEFSSLRRAVLLFAERTSS